ncbi:MAG TPA: glycosyltransferase family 4 protein [Thermoplasmata archaeon]|nr:glycosyltransferase family 4 protein [Thermoplasmata archaeon]
MSPGDSPRTRRSRERRRPAATRRPSKTRAQPSAKEARSPTRVPSEVPLAATRRERIRRSGKESAPPTLADLEALTRDLTWTRPPRREPKPKAPTAARRLHILMVGWEFPPHHSGGLGVHCYELCKELTRMGHRVTFLSPFTGPFTEVPGVTFRFPGEPPAPDADPAAAPWPLTYDHPIDMSRPYHEAMVDYNGWIEALRGLQDVDVLHVHDWFGTVGAASLARRLGRPLVMTVHSTEYDRSLGHPWTEILQREQSGMDAADRVIAVSRHLKAQLQERYRVPADKIRVIYNAVRPSERLARLASPEPVVLYLGRLAAMKGVDTFLRAGARVLQQNAEVLFVVAGEGPEFPHLLTLAAHLGIGDHVLFLGKVNETERAELLARASVFVLPSVVEPFGIAALEAMAAGVPTIVSKTSGVAEVSSDVFAVDFWDTDEFASRIVELLEYPALRSTMGARGQQDALKDGWAERAIETVGVYAELTARSGTVR